MTTQQTLPTLVTSGTGKTGRRVAGRLGALGVPVRVASRSGEPPFDWQDPATWDGALDGMGAVYLAFQPDLAAPGAEDAVRAFMARAAAAGVVRTVLLSGRGEPAAEACERIVRAAGAEVTVIRANWFLQNFSEGEFRDGVVAGTLALPVADHVVEPFVDAEDIADVAAAALTQPGHAGAVYEVSGPRALTLPEVCSEIVRATGRPLRYEPVPMEAFREALSAVATPAEVIELLTYVFTEVLDGRNAQPADGVQRALGRPPRDVVAWARAMAAEGGPGGPPGDTLRAAAGRGPAASTERELA